MPTTASPNENITWYAQGLQRAISQEETYILAADHRTTLAILLTTVAHDLTLAAQRLHLPPKQAATLHKLQTQFTANPTHN